MTPFANELLSLGHQVIQPTLVGPTNAEHLDELTTLLECSSAPHVCIAHSGGGSYLPALDPKAIEAYIFLDAIFPTRTASRFDYFDSPEVVNAWREMAKANSGQIPASYLSNFGSQITDARHQKQFNAGLRDVGIALYEEMIPCRDTWPNPLTGLYCQWTAAYDADADRATAMGFEVEKQDSSHFELMNNPYKLARRCIDWCNENRRSHLAHDK